MLLSVKINLFDKTPIKAFADITLDQSFVVKGLKVMDGRNGLFVSMPSQKNKNGEYKDTAFPITKEFRQQIIDQVLDAYNKTQGQQNQGSQHPSENLPF